MKTKFNDFLSKMLHSFSHKDIAVTPEVKDHVEYVLIGDSLIPNLDGSQLIYQQKSLFNIGTCDEFKKIGLNRNKKTTPETMLSCYEIRSMGRYGKNLKALPGNWSQKCVTQHQVINFCQQSRNLLTTRHDASTMFLCKINENKPINEVRPYDNLIVASVYVHDKGLHIVCFPLHFGDTFRNQYFYRIVMPKI